MGLPTPPALLQHTLSMLTLSAALVLLSVYTLTHCRGLLVTAAEQ